MENGSTHVSGPSPAPDPTALPTLLKAWRARAARRLGLPRPLTQRHIAQQVGVSERWFRKLEAGENVRTNRDTLDRLADALLLDNDARAILYLHTLRLLPVPQQTGDGQTATKALDLLLTRLDHAATPAFLTDQAWDVLAHNATMAGWFPWFENPKVNLARWLLTDPTARAVFPQAGKTRPSSSSAGFASPSSTTPTTADSPASSTTSWKSPTSGNCGTRTPTSPPATPPRPSKCTSRHATSPPSPCSCTSCSRSPIPLHTSRSSPP